MTVISVIIGSTREGRFSEKPAKWILQHLKKRASVDARLLDLRDFPMPFFDQPATPAMPGRPPYKNEVVQRWTAAIAQSDGFVFVTPEYNYGPSAVPRNNDRASARADSLIGPHPCRHLVGSLPRRRCRRRTGRVGGARRNADRRSLVVDCSLEGGARQRVLTAAARRRLSFPRYFQRNSNDPCPIYLTASATGASDHAPYPWPDERPRHTFDEPVRLGRDPETIRVSRPFRP